MLGNDGQQAALHFSKGLFPSGFNELTIALDQRLAQPVRIFMQVFQRHAFGADEPMAEHIVVCPTNAQDLIALRAHH